MSERMGTVPGTVIHEAEVKNLSSVVSVMKGVSIGEAEIKTSGLVVTITGGKSLPQSDPICFAAQELAIGIASRGGVIVNGGENGGPMLAVTSVARDYTLGVACTYHDVIPYGTKAVVNSYQTRKMIIAVMPVVVIFPGQVGTLDELMTCIGWIKSLEKQNAEPPKLWAHEYWWDVLQLLNKKGAIQDNVWDKIHRFRNIDEILVTLRP